MGDCIRVLILLVVSMETTLVRASGTSPYFKDIFMGRCSEYQSIMEQNKITALKTDLNCTLLWNALFKAFAHKDPCHVTVDSYKPFFDLIDVSKKIDNTLFWSGSHELVSEFRSINDDYIALEDTFSGYLFNGLTWCGSQTSPDGLNHTHCISSGKKCNPMYHVWFLSSAKFALRATGTAHVLLNASRKENRPAYYKDSFFRTVEMPRLHVDKLVVYVASSIGRPVRETCGSQSIKELNADARKRNISVECIDQPRLVLRIFCVKYPKAKECLLKYVTDSNETMKWRVLAIIFSVLCVLLLLGITIWSIHRVFSRKARTLQVECTRKDTVNNNATVTITTEKPRENGNNVWI